MTGKRCPFDKGACIGGECMLFLEEIEECGLLVHCRAGQHTGSLKPGLGAKEKEPVKKDRPRFKAELFD